MTFNNIFKDNSNCNCLKESFEDYQTYYIRKLKSENLSDLDFIINISSFINKIDVQNCNDFCAHIGASINKLTSSSDNFQQIMKKYTEVFKVSPKKVKFYCKFKFKDGAGKIKDYSSVSDPNHHNFYYADNFNYNSHIDVLEIKNIQV